MYISYRRKPSDVHHSVYMETIEDLKKSRLLCQLGTWGGLCWCVRNSCCKRCFALLVILARQNARNLWRQYHPHH